VGKFSDDERLTYLAGYIDFVPFFRATNFSLSSKSQSKQDTETARFLDKKKNDLQQLERCIGQRVYRVYCPHVKPNNRMAVSFAMVGCDCSRKNLFCYWLSVNMTVKQAPARFYERKKRKRVGDGHSRPLACGLSGGRFL